MNLGNFASSKEMHWNFCKQWDCIMIEKRINYEFMHCGLTKLPWICGRETFEHFMETLKIAKDCLGLP